ncbi:MAG TPA: T9SS type A sorting domain-containing protein [Bacteroidales bacterium]|nr:T9SS type A sorting domain-containing protein [Bacteroidales bacterium]
MKTFIFLVLSALLGLQVSTFAQQIPIEEVSFDNYEPEWVHVIMDSSYVELGFDLSNASTAFLNVGRPFVLDGNELYIAVGNKAPDSPIGYRVEKLDTRDGSLIWGHTIDSSRNGKYYMLRDFKLDADGNFHALGIQNLEFVQNMFITPRGYWHEMKFNAEGDILAERNTLDSNAFMDFTINFNPLVYTMSGGSVFFSVPFGNLDMRGNGWRQFDEEGQLVAMDTFFADSGYLPAIGFSGFMRTADDKVMQLFIRRTADSNRVGGWKVDLMLVEYDSQGGSFIRRELQDVADVPPFLYWMDYQAGQLFLFGSNRSGSISPEDGASLVRLDIDTRKAWSHQTVIEYSSTKWNIMETGEVIFTGLEWKGGDSYTLHIKSFDQDLIEQGHQEISYNEGNRQYLVRSISVNQDRDVILEMIKKMADEEGGLPIPVDITYFCMGIDGEEIGLKPVVSDQRTNVQELKVYPNPTSHWLIMSKTHNWEFLQVVDRQGRIQKEITNGYLDRMYVGDLVSGIYQLIGQTKGGEWYQSSFIKI